MQYLNSSDVNSFPSSKRAGIHKLMSENSVTRLINRLIDVDGFVITTGLNIDFLDDVSIVHWDNRKEFEFVLRGYYFAVSNSEYDSGLRYLLSKTNFNYTPAEHSEHTLNARIYIDTTDTNFPELYGQSDINVTNNIGEDTEYKAIVFYVDNDVPPDYPSETGTYDFYDIVLVKHLELDNGTWANVVPLDALFKFSSKSISSIDGGEISL